MPKFAVSLNPAALKDGFITTTFSLKDGPVSRKEFEARTADEVVSIVSDFAKEYGKGCSASVRMIEGSRKPAGFDAKCRNLYFNLEDPN